MTSQLFSPDVVRSLAFASYRFRHLVVYVVIGAGSLVLELVVHRGAEGLGLAPMAAAAVGLLTGILFAYWGNVRFNFKVPAAKRRRALQYFAAISLLSWSVQFVLRREIADSGWSYEQARLALSGLTFGLAYVLHRRFSFADFKKVGVAVYANGIEDIQAIRRRIGDFADIIHVDLVDRSYGRTDEEVRTYRLEAIRAHWPNKPIHVHIMSRHPSRYLPELYPHVDRIYIHAEIDEDVIAVLGMIRAAGREAGAALRLDSPVDRLMPMLPHVSGVLFLAIAEPGRSGQPFEMATLERIAACNQWPDRARFDVCIDGGVTEFNVGLLNVEIVVSGSSVLTHADPTRQIMRLQTSSSYETV